MKNTGGNVPFSKTRGYVGAYAAHMQNIRENLLKGNKHTHTNPLQLSYDFHSSL